MPVTVTPGTLVPPCDLDAWIAQQRDRVERALYEWVCAPADHPGLVALVDAMRYAVLDGGKRIRPLLVLAAFDAVRGGLAQDYLPAEEWEDEVARRGAPAVGWEREEDPAQSALRAACAVELVHAYSLVHDDMPCMDDDTLRRGKPTVHVQFGQALALLAGDALQALAFELLTPTGSTVPVARQARLCRLLARAVGCAGMAGGQAVDLASIGQPLAEPALRAMHERKTGTLLQASVLMGAACGETTSAVVAALESFGAAIGLAFQVVDDILDTSSDTATLGKTVGKDARQQKPTYVSVLGVDVATQYAHSLRDQALSALGSSGLADTRLLQGLAHRLVDRAS
nr:polyprenyl synthetase family protein [Candidatus Symbiobacter mobilis]